MDGDGFYPDRRFHSGTTGPDRRSCWPSLDEPAVRSAFNKRGDAAVCACIPTLNNISAQERRGRARPRLGLMPEGVPQVSTASALPGIPVAIQREASGETLN
jgi:hypothetical protein